MAKKMNPVVWFEIPATNLTRAKKFYEGVFNVKLHSEEMGATKMAMFRGGQGATGTSGSLVKARGYKPSLTGTVLYFSVPSVSVTLRKVKARGGKALMPKTSIGKWGGFVAQFRDTEGNRVAVHSMK